MASGPGLRRDDDPVPGPPLPLPASIDSSALGSLLPRCRTGPPCPRPFLSSMSQRSPRPLPLPTAGTGRSRPALETLTGRQGAEVRWARPRAFPRPSLGCRWATAPQAGGVALSGLSPGGRCASRPAPLPARAQPRPRPRERRAAALLPRAGPRRDRAAKPGRDSLPAQALPAPVLRRRSHGAALVRFRQCLRTMQSPYPGSR